MKQKDAKLVRAARGALAVSLEFGIQHSDKVMSLQPVEHRRLKDMICYSRQADPPIVKNQQLKPSNLKKDDRKRDCLTADGLAYLRSIIDDGDDGTVRRIKGKDVIKQDGQLRLVDKKRDLPRLIRVADTVSFLAGAGVYTAHTAIWQLGVNPYLFGLPRPKGKAYHKCIVRKDVSYIRYMERRGTPLPSVTGTDCLLFLELAAIPVGRISVDTGEDELKCYNDILGVLINTGTRDVFAILKTYDRERIKQWHGQAYSSFGSRIRDRLRQLGYVDWANGTIYAAILLCESNADLVQKVACAKNMREPYKCIYPITMSPQGLRDMLQIINTDRTVRGKIGEQEAFDCCEDLTRDAYYRNVIRYQNRWAYIGVHVNCCELCRLHYKIREEIKYPYIIGYEDQVQMYQEFLQEARKTFDWRIRSDKKMAKSRRKEHQKYIRETKIEDQIIVIPRPGHTNDG